MSQITRYENAGAIFSEDFKAEEEQYSYTNATVVDTVHGKRLNFANGSFTMFPRPFVSYLCRVDDNSYAFNGKFFTNGIQTSDYLGITETGFSGLTGTVVELIFFDRVLNMDEIQCYSDMCSFDYIARDIFTGYNTNGDPIYAFDEEVSYNIIRDQKSDGITDLGMNKIEVDDFWSNIGRFTGISNTLKDKTLIAVWKTTTSNKTVNFPSKSGYSYNGIIDWGDGTGEQSFTAWDSPALTHTYVTAGEYTVKVSGVFGCISEYTRSAPEMIKILSIGNTDMVYIANAFRAGNLQQFNGGDGDLPLCTNMYGMFYDANNLTSIVFKNSDLSAITNMSYLCYSCGLLNNFEMTKCDLSSLTDISRLFRYCTALTNISFAGSTFSSSSIINTDWVDGISDGVITLDISNATFGQNSYKAFTIENDTINSVNASNTTFNGNTLSVMFYTCDYVTDIDMSNASFPNATSMYQMFYSCDRLNSLDRTGWDYSNITTMNQMFYFCQALTEITFDSEDMSSLEDIRDMMKYCGLLNNFEMTNCDLSSLIYISGLFRYCTALTNISFAGSTFGSSSIINTDWVDGISDGVITLDISNATFGQNSYDTFTIENDTINSVNASNTTFNGNTLSRMFYACDYVTDIDMSNASFPNATSMYQMFYSCDSLKRIDVTGWDISNITTFTSFLYGVTLDTDSYSDMLIQFASSTLPKTGISFHGGGSKYNAAGEVARNYLIANYNWSFIDGGLV
jgi:surface protein